MAEFKIGYIDAARTTIFETINAANELIARDSLRAKRGLVDIISVKRLHPW